LDYGSLYRNNFNKPSRGISEKLQRANIIVDCKIRIGTCEVTRRGMKKNEMLKIAELIKRTIIDKEQPGNIKKEIAKLCTEFQKVEYCFES
jgi:glycine hydroxymethyltransferase